MSKRSLVYWIIALPLIAISLHPFSVEASEKKPEWALVSVAAIGGAVSHTIVVRESEAECLRMARAIKAKLDDLNIISGGGLICVEIKDPDDKPKLKLKLKKEFDS